MKDVSKTTVKRVGECWYRATLASTSLMGILMIGQLVGQFRFVTVYIPAPTPISNHTTTTETEASASLKAVTNQPTLTATAHAVPRLSWKEKLIYESKHPILVGKPITTPKFLTIGISSAFRAENYLRGTLDLFIKESTPEERQNATIILYLADLDLRVKESQVEMISKEFDTHLKSGFLQLIYSERTDWRPQLSEIRRTFNDPIERVRWRSNQVLDFAFLMSYASNTSEYYMVMEDDIVPARGYLSTIRNYIETRNNDRPWLALEFAELSCISMTFHARALENLAEFFLLFYNDLPVDFLFRRFIELQVPDPWSVKKRIPSIFQHIGLKSTLKGKIQNARDASFEVAKRQFDHQNPPATLSTTMMIHEDCVPRNAYERATGFFWGIPAKKPDYLTIQFQALVPIPVTRIYIKLANQAFVQKRFNGELELEYGAVDCQTFSKLDSLKKNTELIDKTFDPPSNVTYLRLVINSQDYSNGIIISEIEVFTAENVTRKTQAVI